MERPYLITVTLLILHQMDAAYWQEWEMFFLPGGIQGYLLFNLLVIPLVLLGYRSVVLNADNASRWAYSCGVLGVLTFCIHVSFFYWVLNSLDCPFHCSFWWVAYCHHCGCAESLILILNRGCVPIPN